MIYKKYFGRARFKIVNLKINWKIELNNEANKIHNKII